MDLTEENVEDLQEDELIDDAEKRAEIEKEVYEDTSPEYKGKEDLFSLFWKVVRTKQSSKVGNLDKTELGWLDISVRDHQRIALIAQVLGHRGFARFFMSQGEILLATSASKKGWLPELFVSAKKFSTRAREIREQQQGIAEKKKRRGLFGRR